MRIVKLELSNYKCFKNLILEDLNNRVVLVGPNGCGKSTVLEAIAVLKEFVATYDPNPQLYYRRIPPLNRTTTAWPSDMPLPIRSGCPEATISAVVELEEQEMALAQSEATTTELSISIKNTGEVEPRIKSQGITNLFNHFDPSSGIGVIDYIAAHRTYPMQKIKTFDLNLLSLDQQRKERIELQKPNFNYLKFRSIKQFIISKQLEDTSHYNKTKGKERRNSLGLLISLFEEFFAPKKLVGYEEIDGEMQVIVETPGGDHDIDQLSSGEKELFSVLVNLFRIRTLPSVILYDEPERHLNAGIEAKIVPALDRLQSRNQLWLATHGIELIGSVPFNEIIELKRAGNTYKPERLTDESRTRRIRLFE